MIGPHPRRRFLRSLGVGAFGFAGCTENRSTPPYPETRTATETEQRTATRRPTDTPTETEGATETEIEPQPGTFVPIHGLDLSANGGVSAGRFYDLIKQNGTVVCTGELDGSLALVAVGESLDVEWSRVYTDWRPIESYYSFLLSAFPSTDGGYLVGAKPKSEAGLGVLKTNARGEVRWIRNYEPATSLHLDSASGIEFGDGSYAYVVSASDPDAVETTLKGFETPDGPVQWERRYETAFVRDVAATPDGGCLLSGFKHRSGFWMAKLDSDGDERWEFEPGNYNYAGVRQIEDGFVLWGTKTDSGTPVGPRIKVLDEERRERWERTHDRPRSNVSAVAVTDDGYLLASDGDEGIWLTELDDRGDVLSRAKYGDEPNASMKPFDVVDAGDRWIVVGEDYNENVPEWIVEVEGNGR